MTKYCTDEMLRSKVLYDDENINFKALWTILFILKICHKFFYQKIDMQK